MGMVPYLSTYKHLRKEQTFQMIKFFNFIASVMRQLTQCLVLLLVVFLRVSSCVSDVTLSPVRSL